MCVCVCLAAPSGERRWACEECDYSAQWGGASIWQLWLKMEQLALRVHAGKAVAEVTCAAAAVTFTSITLEPEHRHAADGQKYSESPCGSRCV